MTRPEHELRLREAALVLHGLHWRDRLWMLRRLLPAWRSRVTSLLRELRQLGIAPALGCAHELPALYALKLSFDSASLARVDQASTAQMRALLSIEPVAMQARVLCLRAWPWREALWSSMSPLQRLRVLAHASAEPALPVGLAAAILQSVQTALRDEEAATAPGAGDFA